MFKLIQLIFASLAIVAVNGLGSGIQFIGNMKHPDDPNQCYFEEHKLPIPINKTVYPTNLKNACIKVLCRDDFVLEVKHCRNIDTNSECTLTQSNDYSKPFPECCPVKTCKGNRVIREEDY